MILRCLPFLALLLVLSGCLPRPAALAAPESAAAEERAYVRSGDSYRMTGIADGSYQIYFSKGGKWDDGAKVFTQNVSRQRFDDVFPFETTATTYSIWQVTLYGVTDGNASSSHVPAEQFPELP